MLRQRAHVVYCFTTFSDALGFVLAFVAAHLLRNSYIFDDQQSWREMSERLGFLGITIALALVVFGRAGLYHSFRLRTLGDEADLVTRCFLKLAALLALVICLLKLEYVSRLFLCLFMGIAWLSVLAVRMLARRALHSIRRSGRNCSNILIVGTEADAQAVAEAIEQNRHWGVRTIGHLADFETSEPSELPTLGKLEDLGVILRENIIDGVIFTSGPERLPLIQPAFDYCHRIGVAAYYYSHYFDPPELNLERIAGVNLIAFPVAGYETQRALGKRALDLGFGMVLLVLFAPVMMAAAILIKLTSSGPVIFRQERVGINGRRFTLYKFRTMVWDAERRREELLVRNEMDGPVFKIANDPRITRMGRLLRRISFDELPQLVNVLLGQMSIVGPRPPLAEEVGRYEDWQRRRLSVKPGLTCLWQVSGRNHIDFRRWMQLDLEYIDHWSWWLDLKIMLRTVPAMLRGQ